MSLRTSLAGSLRHGRTAAAGLLAGAGSWILLTGAGAAPELQALPGHVSPLAQARFDLGEAPDSLPIHSLELVLAKTPAQERALEQLLDEQQDPQSPQYHQWLTPAQYGERFGASAAAITALSAWLTGNGFSVDAAPASRARLRFHGSKAQVEAAFHTRIHVFNVRGERHFANVSAPQVPAALVPLIGQIRGLDDFYPRPGVRTQRVRALGVHQRAGPAPQVTYDDGQVNWVGPTDFATIYNLLPLYKEGINGAGVTIAIAGESDIDASIASLYWTGFGVSPPQFTSIPVPGGTDPGQTDSAVETEAFLDVELAGGLAPGAKILLVRDGNAFDSAQYVIDQNLAGILNISFAECESDLTAAGNAALSSMFEQAASQGITVTVATGDDSVAACFTSTAVQGDLSTSGFAVNGIASTPYDLAVGGTDFDPTQSQAWAATNAPGTLANAEGHIPEMVWNDSCANPLIAQFLGFSSTATFCNTTTQGGQPNPYLEVFGAGSGLSSCLSMTNGTCAGGYPQPAWQAGVDGIGTFGARAVPDVAVIASAWVVCSYDTPSCDPATETVDFVAGTSAAAPSVAAIIALLDQTQISAASADGRQGLINPQLYRLAAAEYGTPQAPDSSLSSCSASLGLNIGSQCVFYDVVAGSSAAPCEVAAYSAAGSSPASTCTASSGQANGIMDSGGAARYTAAAGFNLATGLGSINATALVNSLFVPAPTGLAARASGQTVTLTWSADARATSFNVFQGTQSGQEGATPVMTGVTGTSAAVSGLGNGQTYYFTVQAVGTSGASVASGEVDATIAPGAPAGLAATAGTQTVSLSWTASPGATSYNVYQGTTAGSEGTQPVQAVAGTSITISALTGGTTYYFKVAAVDAGGVGALSAEAQATPSSPPSSGGGGGACGWLELALLAVLAASRGFGGDRLARTPRQFR
jgi:subtilase family serine protease